MRILIISGSVNAVLLKMTMRFLHVVSIGNDHGSRKSLGISTFTATCPALAGQAQRSRYERKGYLATVSAFICENLRIHLRDLREKTAAPPTSSKRQRFPQICADFSADHRRFFQCILQTFSPTTYYLLPTYHSRFTIHVSRVHIICENLRIHLRDLREKTAAPPTSSKHQRFPQICADFSADLRRFIDTHDSPLTIHGSRFTIRKHSHALPPRREGITRFFLLQTFSPTTYSQLTTHDSRLTSHDSRLTIHVSRLTRLSTNLKP